MYSFNVNSLFYRFKHLFFVLTTLVAVACVYALLSFVYVGRTDAVPLKWQKHLEISQQELYKNLDNFSIVGVDRNVIRSDISEFANIRVDLGNRASKDYEVVSLVVSRLNDTNGWHRNVWVEMPFADMSGKLAERRFPPLKDGFNSSRAIRGGVPEQLTIRMNANIGLSMELERVYLSKYPALPDKFITPFIVLSIFALFISWCCFYRGLHSWLFARNWALLIIIIATQLLVLAYYRDQAKYGIGEEVPSILMANASIDELTDNVWHSSQELFNAVTAQPEDKLKRDGSYHSSSHVTQLHLVYLLFPNTFSYWFGVLLNIPYYVGICILLYLVSRHFMRGRLALLPVVFYGFSAAGLYSPIFARSYTLAPFFCMLSIYLVLEILTQPKITKKVYVLLALSAFLGIDAHNFLGTWLAAISIVPAIKLLKDKRFATFAKCLVALLVGFFMYLVILDGSSLIRDYLSTASGSGSDSGKSILSYFNIVAYIELMMKSLDYLFGGVARWCIFVIVVMGILYYKNYKLYVYPNRFELSCDSTRGALQRGTLPLCASIALALLGFMLPFRMHTLFVDLSYVQSLSIAPPLILLFTLLINELVSKVITDTALRHRLIAGVLLLMSFAGFEHRVKAQTTAYYQPRHNYAKIAEPYRNTPVISIYSPYSLHITTMMNLRESIALKPNDIAAFERALEHVRNDDNVIIYYSPGTPQLGYEQELKSILETMHQRGYTEQVPFIGKMSWLCAKK
ncbi:hypothetical protein RsTz2092_08680 [Deferribacterales bacterium RsTz2092]|nr:hypothetical protein AGMMS49941_05960 [Deferribacterales bacterium]